MKIYLPKKTKGVITGKNFFFDRLSLALTSLGATVTRDPVNPHDISFQSIFIDKTFTKKYVLRLDGCHHNIDTNYKKVNRSIVVKGLSHANAVVYQSQFSQSICEKYMGKFKGKSVIIPNGAPVVKLVENPNSFLAIARWRPHKRLEDTIESFLLAKLDTKVKLYVIGELRECGLSATKIKNYQSLLNVVFLNLLDQKELSNRLKRAYANIHICWLDNCPNSVIETIAAGVPVITNNAGGTHEIVEPSGGIVLSIDEPYDLSPCHLYKPPAIDRKKVAEAIRSCYEKKIKIDALYTDIGKVAKQHIDFFEEVLR